MCITLRDQTEWIELVDNGYNILCGISEFDIIQNCHKVLTVNVNFNKNLYGNGSCGEIILNELTSFLL
jgi:UDP-GlcNAc3NAcA epimerase